MLAIAPGIIGVGTVRNMNVPVTVEIRDQEPDVDVQAWDYVVEATLDVASGRIVVAGCSDYFPDAMRITVPPGSYRVIAFERRHSTNYRDPAAMARFSTWEESVSVKVSDKATLDLDAVPAQEMLP